jgi:hypothetical protein
VIIIARYIPGTTTGRALGAIDALRLADRASTAPRRPGLAVVTAWPGPGTEAGAPGWALLLRVGPPRRAPTEERRAVVAAAERLADAELAAEGLDRSNAPERWGATRDRRLAEIDEALRAIAAELPALLREAYGPPVPAEVGWDTA